MKVKKKSTSNVKMIDMNSNTLSTLVKEYTLLLAEVDSWFTSCQEIFPGEIACAKGCSECCCGLFDITILDAVLLNIGFETLSAPTKAKIRTDAEIRMKRIRILWPEFNHPFILNHRSEEEIELLMSSDNDTKCLLLDDQGRCLLYDYRPMTCRLHGLPLIDAAGEVMESEWCTRNFVGSDPLQLTGLSGPFDSLFREEAAMVRRFTRELLGKAVHEFDTFIPASLLMDFRKFDWRKWFAENPLKT